MAEREPAKCADIIIGVDTHKAVHAAVALNGLGTRLADIFIPVSSKGYRDLEAWASALGNVRVFGIEGTGSYGAGLTRSLLARGHHVVEVNRPNRQLRYRHGKSDTARATHWTPKRRPGPFWPVRQTPAPKLAPARWK